MKTINTKSITLFDSSIFWEVHPKDGQLIQGVKSTPLELHNDIFLTIKDSLYEQMDTNTWNQGNL